MGAIEEMVAVIGSFVVRPACMVHFVPFSDRWNSDVLLNLQGSHRPPHATRTQEQFNEKFFDLGEVETTPSCERV